MHGLIFASFRDYLVTEHGAGIANEVTAGEPQYTLSEAYPDEQFLALLERACVRTGLSPGRVSGQLVIDRPPEIEQVRRRRCAHLTTRCTAVYRWWSGWTGSEVATGKVVDACLPRHRHQEFLRFLN